MRRCGTGEPAPARRRSRRVVTRPSKCRVTLPHASQGEPMTELRGQAARREHLGRIRGGSSSGTMACSAAVGAPGSTRSMPRRRSPPRGTAPSRSGWSRRAAHTQRWRSTAMTAVGVAPVRQPGGTAEHRPPQGVRGRSRRPPDYRITCIFVDKKHRRKGVTAAALRGAVDPIAEAGGRGCGGRTRTTQSGQKVSVLSTAHGPCTSGPASSYPRPKGKRNCVMRRVAP